jgi:PAS domain S-box-containing protein
MAISPKLRRIVIWIGLLGLVASLSLLALALHQHADLLETTSALEWTEDVAGTLAQLQRCSGSLAGCIMAARNGLADLEQDERRVERELVIRLDALLAQAQRRGDSDAIQEITTAASPLLASTREELLTDQNDHGTAVRTLLLAAMAFAVLTALALALLASSTAISEPGELTTLLASAVRSTEEGILITDTGSSSGTPSIVFVNESFKRLTLRSDRELIGQPLSVLRQSSLQEQEFSLLEHGHSNSRSATIETVEAREDGSSVHCAWHISPVRSPSGQVTHFISVLRDITKLREHEEAQRQSHRKLIEAHRKLTENQAQLIQSEKLASLGQLAAGVAHEINNPIGYVMSNVEMLADDLGDLRSAWTKAREISETPDLDDEQRILRLHDVLHNSDLNKRIQELDSLIDASHDGLIRVRDIVQNLRRFARADDSELQVADLNEELETALKIVWNELKHRCDVVTSLGDLPPYRCRPAQLNQVFANLLINAGQAIHDSGQIWIRTAADSNEIRIQIEDTGEGIPPEHRSKLFDPFFTTKPAGRGTGLGLAVSYGIVQQHGGSIEVDSSPGSGSTFTVRLPLADRSAPDTATR